MELTRRMYDYAKEHGGEPDWELLADDLRVVNLPDAPWQPSSGIEGMREWVDFAREVAEDWSMEVDGIEDLGPEFVLVHGRLRMKFRATGIEDEAPLLNLCKVVDGKLKRLESYYTREQALEAAGLPSDGALK